METMLMLSSPRRARCVQSIHLMIAKENDGRALGIGIALLPVQRPSPRFMPSDSAQATCGNVAQRSCICAMLP